MARRRQIINLQKRAADSQDADDEEDQGLAANVPCWMQKKA
jgi:hypothetical protein